MKKKLITLINDELNSEGLYETSNFDNISERVSAAETMYMEQQLRGEEDADEEDADLEAEMVKQGFTRVYIDEEVNLKFF